MNLKNPQQKSCLVYSLPVLLLSLYSVTQALVHTQQVKGPPSPTKQPPPTVKCVQPVPLPPGVKLNAQCQPFISNIKKLLDSCPTTDPAYAQIKKDFQIRRNGKVIINLTCNGSVPQLPTSQYTEELIILQALRVIYYLDKGKPGQLPWTSSSFYDWLRAQVSGFNIDEKASNASCCAKVDGKVIMTLRTENDFNKDFKKRWIGIAGMVALFAHERRHLDGFAHINCSVGKDIDQDYDEKNLSPFGIQWWLYKNWLTGGMNVGFSCLPSGEQSQTTDYFFSALEGYRKNRFCGKTPPVINKNLLFGPCTDPLTNSSGGLTPTKN
jgi:hypothetical protein